MKTVILCNSSRNAKRLLLELGYLKPKVLIIYRGWWELIKWLRDPVRAFIHIGKAHDYRVLNWLSANSFDVGFHALATIYKQPFIEKFRIGILNAHIGLLPKYRGRSVFEWSIYNEDPTGISVFLIDTGIDTGPVVYKKKLDPCGFGSLDEAKEAMFNLDGVMYRYALRHIGKPKKQTAGKRWGVMGEPDRLVANARYNALGCFPEIQRPRRQSPVD